MKTNAPIQYKIAHPVPGDHRHTAKRNLDLINRIAVKLDACINLLQPLGSSGAWTNSLEQGRLASITASTAQVDLLGIRDAVQELQENLAQACTPYDQANAVCHALRLNDRLGRIFARSDSAEDYADELLHDILKGRTDW